MTKEDIFTTWINYRNETASISMTLDAMKTIINELIEAGVITVTYDPGYYKVQAHKADPDLEVAYHDGKVWWLTGHELSFSKVYSVRERVL